jgi:DNA-binding MarR family transcriptional regulator
MLSLSHVLMLMRIAEAGDEGVESSQLAADGGVSAASVSRTMRAFWKVQYSKKHPGFDLVEFGFDLLDNRRRLARLTPEGRLLVRRALEAIK